MALTPKQQRFVEEYVVDFNAAAAARRAGYSARTARSIGQENLTKPDIQVAIAIAAAAISKVARIAAEDVWRGWKCLAMSNIKEMFDLTGETLRLKRPSDIPDSAWLALKTIKSRRYTEGHGDEALEVEVTEFALWDKLAALGMVARALGMLKDQVVHTGPGGGPVQVETTVVDARAKILSFAAEFREAALQNLAEAAMRNGHQNGDGNAEEEGSEENPAGTGAP